MKTVEEVNRCAIRRRSTARRANGVQVLKIDGCAFLHAALSGIRSGRAAFVRAAPSNGRRRSALRATNFLHMKPGITTRPTMKATSSARIEMKQTLSTFFKRLFSSRSVQDLPEQDSGVKKIELTLIRFVPEPVPVTCTVASAAEALAWLDLAVDADCFIEASVREGNYSVGDFSLWCSGDFACATIAEHRGHDASHPDSTFVAPDTVEFKDDEGSLYRPPREHIVPRQLATEALRAWLVDQEHPPMLRWN